MNNLPKSSIPTRAEDVQVQRIPHYLTDDMRTGYEIGFVEGYLFALHLVMKNGGRLPSVDTAGSSEKVVDLRVRQAKHRA